MARPAQVAPEGSVASNVSFVTPTGTESCAPAYLFTGPEGLVEREGRLIEPLRQVARKARPFSALVLSAKSFALGNPALGRAYADLAVTGRHSYGNFRLLHAKGVLTPAKLFERLHADPDVNWVPTPTLLEASNRALDRAYEVANVLPFGGSPDRPDLGWIAVSGEDDPPYRPVNVSSARFPQYDLMVRVDGRWVHTRYMIADGFVAPTMPSLPGRQLPVLPEPQLAPDAKVLLYIHGMDSRVEEALDLVAALREISRETGENWTVISMDFPTSGYAEKLDPQDISPIQDVGNPRDVTGFDAHGTHRVPVLDFMEKFTVSFVDTLNQKIPIKDHLQAVIGGSFGGNITFRLGRRHDLPWLKNVVSWSPASIWAGLADGGDPFKQLGVATAWNRAGGDPSTLPETTGSRFEFFNQSFGGSVMIGPLTLVPTQPEHWWSRSWPCFDRALASSRIERQEIYARDFRLWHWRLAVEQLIYSQQGAPDLPKPLYMNNFVRMLLASGEDDDFNFTKIFDSTRDTALHMTATPGRAIFLRGTGHSIHNERPHFFAREIVKFLDGK